MNDQLLSAVIAEQPYPLLFATISGAHLYGFASPDSDVDLRGVHLLPLRDVIGLRAGPETIEQSVVRDGTQVDLVTHDGRKFFQLMLKPNGYVLEQLTSPLVVESSSTHLEMLALVPECVTRHHSRHYLGFATSQWQLFERDQPRRVKPLLYAYRVLLTGIHLMRTGAIEANLVRLNESFALPYLPELIARKVAGPEQATLTATDTMFYEAEYRRLVGELEDAARHSRLPEAPSAEPALAALLVGLRLATNADASEPGSGGSATPAVIWQ